MLCGIPPSIHHGTARKVMIHGMLVSLFRLVFHCFTFRFRFKIALLLPIKHSIIYITVISTWNINTSTNIAVHHHGSKGSWKSCGIYGLLVCFTYKKYISTGVQRVQQKKVTQNGITRNYISTTHAVHDLDSSKLLHIAVRLLEKINSLTFGLMLTLRMLFHTETPTYLRPHFLRLVLHNGKW